MHSSQHQSNPIQSNPIQSNLGPIHTDNNIGAEGAKALAPSLAQLKRLEILGMEIWLKVICLGQIAILGHNVPPCLAELKQSTTLDLSGE